MESRYYSFSDYKEINVEIIKDGGWHFTNVKTPEELFVKLSNFGHHNEFELSNTSIDDLKKQIANKIVNYTTILADKTAQNKYEFNYKLKSLDEVIYYLKYLQSNKVKYEELV